MAISLSGRVAVVTGATGGVAGTLAAAGATVVVCEGAAKAAGPAKSAGPGMVAGPAKAGPTKAADLALTLDLADPMALNVLATAVQERYGRIDLLVTAATAVTEAPFASVTARAEHALVGENFTRVTALIRRLLPLMGGGSSVVVLVPEEARHALDAAMKAAVESLCAALAVELAPRGVSVDAVTEPAAYQLWCSGMPSV
ncbi:SDR family oxidoreductase [Nonomuraea sp. NPDC059194]|uniref:SDR family oxidoreductase n=1 Tax=Nonomuraea sp. NPDC059194 TaxID=3346764 RepID=UPI0036864435